MKTGIKLVIEEILSKNKETAQDADEIYVAIFGAIADVINEEIDIAEIGVDAYVEDAMRKFHWPYHLSWLKISP